MVGADEGEILALLGHEAGAASVRLLIHRSIHLGLQAGGPDECTLSCHVDPIRAQRAWGASGRGQAPGPEAQTGATRNVDKSQVCRADRDPPSWLHDWNTTTLDCAQVRHELW